ncbi:MAG: hypothetical protein BJ554DRAFT_1065, partial [Olpidium bornovanus]
MSTSGVFLASRKHSGSGDAASVPTRSHRSGVYNPVSLRSGFRNFRLNAGVHGNPLRLFSSSRVDKASHMESVAYDIEVEVDDPVRNRFMSILAATATGMEIQTFDDKVTSLAVVCLAENALTETSCISSRQISQCIQSISNSRLKRDFLLMFAKSPSSFMNKWIKSQANDLQLILGESKVGLEEYR